jgi:hypothetical protein
MAGLARANTARGLQRQIGDDPVAGRVEVVPRDGDRPGLSGLIKLDFGEDLCQVPVHGRLLDA